MSTFAVQLPSSEPGKSNLFCNAPSSDIPTRPRHGLRPMQSQPNMRYTATAVSTTQLTPFTVHAVSPPSTPPPHHLAPHKQAQHKPPPPPPPHHHHQQQQQQQHQQQPLSRTQQKLMLQRQCFLADDKDYLDHPENMRRLTKELDRVSREYKCIRHFQDPLAQSFRRVAAAQAHYPPRTPLSASCSPCSSPSASPRLQRRSSAQEILISVASKEGAVARKQDGLLVRILGHPLPPPPPPARQHHVRNPL